MISQAANLTDRTNTIHIEQPLAKMIRLDYLLVNMIHRRDSSSLSLEFQQSLDIEPNLASRNLNRHKTE
jgi:hypothetical protein